MGCNASTISDDCQSINFNTTWRHACFLGILSGLAISGGYFVQLIMYAVSGRISSCLYTFGIGGLGDSWSFFGFTIWIVCLGRLCPKRPQWWKLAPLPWLATLISFLVGHGFMELFGGESEFFFDLIYFGPSAISGLLFGLFVLNSLASLILFIGPDGHLKIPHLWPGQNPPPYRWPLENPPPLKWG